MVTPNTVRTCKGNQSSLVRVINQAKMNFRFVTTVHRYNCLKRRDYQFYPTSVQLFLGYTVKLVP